MTNFTWASKKPLDDIATITEANITLNKSATGYFEHAYIVLLGLNEEERLIAIKPITKEEAALGYIPEDQQHNITVKPSYSRVCNKLFIKQVSELVGLNFKANPAYKFDARWDDKEDVLIIDLKSKEV